MEAISSGVGEMQGQRGQWLWAQRGFELP